MRPAGLAGPHARRKSTRHHLCGAGRCRALPGAGPVPGLFEEIPLGAIATNGLAVIPEDISYRIHISIWGNDATSLSTRNAKDMLARQIENYKGDPRAVWVYTFTRHNIAEAERW